MLNIKIRKFRKVFIYTAEACYCMFQSPHCSRAVWTCCFYGMTQAIEVNPFVGSAKADGNDYRSNVIDVGRILLSNDGLYTGLVRKIVQIENVEHKNRISVI